MGSPGGQEPRRIGFDVREVLFAPTLAGGGPKDGIHEARHTLAPNRAGQVHRLRHGGVFRHAVHVEDLIQTQAEGVPHSGIHGIEAPLNLPVQQMVETAAKPLNPVRQLAAPAALPGVEGAGRSGEGPVQPLTALDRAEDLQGGPPAQRHLCPGSGGRHGSEAVWVSEAVWASEGELSPASPGWATTEWRSPWPPYGPRDTPAGPPGWPASWRGPWRLDGRPWRWPCSSGPRPPPAPW